MAFARRIAGAWVEVMGPFVVGDGLDARHYPPGWLDGADDDQRAALGAVAIVEEPTPASALALVGQSLVDVDGVPHRRWIMPPIVDVRATRRAEVAATRWTRQQAMKWRGRIVAADDATLGRLLAIVVQASLPGAAPVAVNWKFGDADFDTLTLPDVVAYATAIGVHLQGCFDREAELGDAIAAAADVATIAAIDVAGGWPA